MTPGPATPATDPASGPANVDTARIILGVRDLDAELAFFTGTLGFRVVAIWPADRPRTATVEGFGLGLTLERGEPATPVRIRIACAGQDAERPSVTSPGGTTIQFVRSRPPVMVPDLVPEFVLSTLDAGTVWGEGRAGMRYRDLIPGRQGGRFIASHIHVPDPGPVPDYVHYHRIRFQLIFCYKGWARLVYEDQGEPFIMNAGDCVLQPPEIRHRVLGSGDGLEVVEIGCPAEHETLGDLELDLPTTVHNPDHDFFGQRFAFHRAAQATWNPWRVAGFESRNFGFGSATGGLMSAQVVRLKATPDLGRVTHDGEFLFLFVLEGDMQVESAGHGQHRMGAGDCVVIPPGDCHRLSCCSSNLTFLEVRAQADLPTTPCN